MSKPNWIDAPEWANWLAQDESGRWYWYENEPSIAGVYWDNRGLDMRVDSQMEILPNRRTWKETLGQRPSNTEFKLLYPTGIATNENPDANTIPPIHPDVAQAVDALRQPETSDGSTTPIPTVLYNRLVYLGIIDLSGNRSTNEGDSNYAEKTIQPHSIWLDYPELTSFDHDVVKRILRTKKGNSRLLEYKKIIHVCNERIRQIEITGVDE